MSPESESVEAPIAPEEVLSAHKILKQAADLVDSGEVESVTVYLNRRDETYQTLQSSTDSRLKEAGLLVEMIMERLGFVTRYTVQAMIDEAVGR